MANISFSEDQEGFLDAQEFENLDAMASTRLKKTFQQSSRQDHLLPTLQKLHRLRMLKPIKEDGVNIQVKCLNKALVLFIRIKAMAFNGDWWTRDELF